MTRIQSQDREGKSPRLQKAFIFLKEVCGSPFNLSLEDGAAHVLHANKQEGKLEQIEKRLW